MWAPRPVVALALCLGMSCALGTIDSHVTTPCSPGATRACDIGNGTGRQTCSDDGAGWSECGNLTGCDPGYNLQQGACVQNACVVGAMRSCDANGASGVQLCNSTGSSWADCMAVICTPGASQPCFTAEFTGSQVCNAMGTAWGDCMEYVCTPGDIAACPLGNDMGWKTCTTDGSAWGACMANACAPDTTQPCHAGNGTGTQMCNSMGSGWGVCGNLTSCDPGYNLQSGACVANGCTPNATQACHAGNGTGTQTCNATGSALGGCGNLTSCDPGFNLQGASCVANVCTPNATQPCHAGNGTGSQTCNATGSALGGCGNLTSCDPGFNLQGASCVANVCTPNAMQVCHAGNGTGTATCNASGSMLGGCGNLTSCDPGYLLFGGVCLQNTFVASYFNNMSLSGSPVVTRNDAAVNFRFGYGDPGVAGSPDPAVPATGWSARWVGDWSFPVSATYRFYATVDDGVRVWLDGNLIIDKWLDEGETTYIADVSVGAGVHSVQVEYYQNTGAAMVVVSWAIRPDALLAAEKSGACTADLLMWSGGAEYFESGGPPHQDDFMALIARSNCHLLNRSIETWFGLPNFSAIQSRMNALATMSGGKPFIHSLNIAEALWPGATGTWHDPLTNTDLSVTSMCQPAFAPDGGVRQYGGLEGTCVPSYVSPTYQQYLKGITQQALDVGARDFLFGGMNLPETKVLLVDDAGVMVSGLAAVDSTVTSAPIYPQLFARLRAYAVSKGVAITIGCQIGGDYGFNWGADTHLKLCDYKYSPMLTSNVDSPSWTPTNWDNPQNANWGLADWNNPGITSQTSVLADYEWWGPTDDPTLFIKQLKPERAAFTFRAAQLLRNAGQALLLPFGEPVYTTAGSQCAALPAYPDNSNVLYSPSAQFCGDEDVFNQALANSPIFIYAEQSHVPVGGHTIIRWWTPTPNTCTVYDGASGFWLNSDYGDTATYFRLDMGGLTSTQTFTIKCPDGSQASTTVFVP